MLMGSIYLIKFILYTMEHNLKWAKFGPFTDCYFNITDSIFAPELVEYRELFKSQNLVIHDSDFHGITTVYNKEEEFSNFIRYAMVPYAIDKIPDALKDQFVGEFKQRYYDYTGRSSNDCKFSSPHLIIIGEKA